MEDVAVAMRASHENEMDLQRRQRETDAEMEGLKAQLLATFQRISQRDCERERQLQQLSQRIDAERAVRLQESEALRKQLDEVCTGSVSNLSTAF